MIVAAKGAGITPDAAGLTGKILGVQVSTIHQAYAEKHFGASAGEIKAYQTQDEANQDLVAGRDRRRPGRFHRARCLPLFGRRFGLLELMGAVADDPAVLGLGVGVGLRKGDEALKGKFNAAIAAVRADGTYDKITANYFASSIYGD